MPIQRTFFEIFEQIHKQKQAHSMSAGWETHLEPTGLSQLIGQFPTMKYSRPHIYRYPKTPRVAHSLNVEQQQAFEAINTYQTIPLHPGFYSTELRSAYRQAVLRTHPDQGGTTESFQQVKKSYEILVAFVTKEK